MRALLDEVLALWRWWLPPMVLIVLVVGVLLVWLGVVDAPIRYSIF